VIDAKYIKRLLKIRHPDKAWIYATEVPTKTGYNAPHDNGLGGLRVIDAFAMSVWPSKEYKRVAYEIKVARSDWLAELEEPTKRAQAWYLADQFYFVLGPGVGDKRDLPRDARRCGVIQVSKQGEIADVGYCLGHDAWPMPDWFVASFLRCVRDQGWSDKVVEDL